LEALLSKPYRLILPDPHHPLEGEFDPVIIDGTSLRQLRPKVQARRKAEVLLPFLLLTVRRGGSLPSRHLGRVVDDVIVRPLNEKELQARLANLVR